MWLYKPFSKWLKATFREDVPVLGSPAPIKMKPSKLGFSKYSIPKVSGATLLPIKVSLSISVAILDSK